MSNVVEPDPELDPELASLLKLFPKASYRSSKAADMLDVTRRQLNGFGLRKVRLGAKREDHYTALDLAKLLLDRLRTSENARARRGNHPPGGEPVSARPK